MPMRSPEAEELPRIVTLSGTTTPRFTLKELSGGTCRFGLQLIRALVCVDKDVHTFYNLVKNSYIYVIIAFYS